MYRRTAGFRPGLSLVLAAGTASGQERFEVRRRAVTAAEMRGWIGISFRTGNDGEVSTLVEAVEPGAPADVAGIRTGDRIVRWNGRNDVIAAINATQLRPGDRVEVRISRNGNDRELSIVAAPRPEVQVLRLDRDVPRGAAAAGRMMLRGDSLRSRADSLQSRLRLMFRDGFGPGMGNPAELRAMLENLRGSPFDNIRAFQLDPGVGAALAFGRSGIAGAEFADVTAGLGAYFGTDRGALVLRVAPNTPAARAGLAEGDVIVRASDQTVESMIDLRRAIAASREDIVLEILRRNERFSVTIVR